MLKRTREWLRGLSLIGKIVAYTAAAVVGGTAVSSFANSNTGTSAPTQIATEVKTKAEPKVEVKIETATEAIPFTKSSANNPSLLEGISSITTVGVNGIKTVTYKVTYIDDHETTRELVSESITQAPVTEITTLGTKKPSQANCDPNYTPCVPNVSHDLDCADIGFRVHVIGSDPHGFDGNDDDGLGCESY